MKIHSILPLKGNSACREKWHVTAAKHTKLPTICTTEVRLRSVDLRNFDHFNGNSSSFQIKLAVNFVSKNVTTLTQLYGDGAVSHKPA